MSINNLVKLNLFYQAIEIQEFVQEIPNTSPQPIETSFNFVYNFPLYDSCDNLKIGLCKVQGNDVSYNNQTKNASNYTQTFFLPNGTLTFSYSTDLSTNIAFLPSDKPIPLSFIYGTGDYFKANVQYASLLPLQDVNRTRIVEIIIQK